MICINWVRVTVLTFISVSVVASSKTQSFFKRLVEKDCSCFNCNLEQYQCTHFGDCVPATGMCDNCPAGFGGEDCIKPLCGSLALGKQRNQREGPHCNCDDGWVGNNCNVCTRDDVCGPLMPKDPDIPETNGTCYQGPIVVTTSYQYCNVTNQKILDMLGDKLPTVTFSCNKQTSQCQLQFWIDDEESFYCGLHECAFEYGDENSQYHCEQVTCECIPDRVLCGRDGSIDITDYFKYSIKGPSDFFCDNDHVCTFEEPGMNQLISMIFAPDTSIHLDCVAGQCLYHTQVPGYKPPSPEKEVNKLAFIITLIVLGGVLVAACFGIAYFRRLRNAEQYVQLDDDERDLLVTDHVATTLCFKNISYTNGLKTILNSMSGIMKPGEITAIMGASGAGKTSLLDILAGRNKSGEVHGEIFVNGKSIKPQEYRRIVGYVDQEDVLMDTLTVEETIMLSALLRLPRTMSLEAKKKRVKDTMDELGIYHIAQTRIGSSESRGISGGEKRRVSIACELVTSPSILFLDEPTSGLDSYNAYNVVECLVTLARNYNRTVIFTIHQPRSNIFALFDKLILLSQGSLVYGGPAEEMVMHLENIGHPCPVGFNIADYIVDLTMHAQTHSYGANDLDSAIIEEMTSQQINSPTRSVIGHVPKKLGNKSVRTMQDFLLYAPFKKITFNSPSESSSPNATLETGTGDCTTVDSACSSVKNSHLQDLIQGYHQSDIANLVKEQIQRECPEEQQGLDTIDGPEITYNGLTYMKKSSWMTQFWLLSGRTFKNLYRNPSLLITHYVISIGLAVFCGCLFYGVSNNIAGFQNRMGLFFFTCALFGFGCLSSIQVFSSERVLFMKERANGYYTPSAYFLAKVLFDVIPLRVFPPIMFGSIIYNMVGLVPSMITFLKFLLVLVMFNLTSASICLVLGILFNETSVASLISSLVMLFSMLFGGLLLNNESVHFALQWLTKLSIFRYAFEALIVNEMVDLWLREEKFGLPIDIPGGVVLSTFGYDAQCFWKNMIALSIMFCTFMIASFAFLSYFVKEKR